MAPRASTPPAGAASRLRRAPSPPFARFSRTASIAPSSTMGNRANANLCATATSAAATTSTEKKGYAMLSPPTHERLISLGLPGMAKAFDDQRRSSEIAALSFEERIGLMVDREAAERDSKRLSTRLKFAALRQNAVVEDVDLRTPRGIDRALFQRLVAGDWINRAEGLLITGPTGVGKSWIACALGQKACRDGRSVIYHRVPRLFEALALARGDGRYGRLLKSLARIQLLILDDWGLSALTEPEQRDLLEILEDRHQRASTIVTSQVPVEQWCEIIGNPPRADAILDRLVHNAHRLPMTGESMRKLSAKKRVLDDAPKA